MGNKTNFIKDIINEIFQSEDMKTYLTKQYQEHWKYDMLNMICSAPIALERKAQLLETLAEEYETDLPESEHSLEDDLYTYKDTAGLARTFLSELNLKPGEIFCLHTYCNESEFYSGTSAPKQNKESDLGCIPFLSYDKVLEYFETEDYIEWCGWEDCWNELEKWIPDNQGNLIHSVSFYILNKKLCYASSDNESLETCTHQAYDLCDGWNLNLPVPFNAGDILTIDCRPFHPVKHIVILEAGDNRDCCCLQGMYIKEDGNIGCGAVKHNNIFENLVFPGIPALISAEKYTGQLPEEESILDKVSRFIDHDETKGKLLWDICSGDGCTIEQLEERMMEHAKY